MDCTVLQELLEHYIDEEEGEFYKIARKIFDREGLTKMGTAFTAENQACECHNLKTSRRD